MSLCQIFLGTLLVLVAVSLGSAEDCSTKICEPNSSCEEVNGQAICVDSLEGASCFVNGVEFKHGTETRDNDPCHRCWCSNGAEHCNLMGCLVEDEWV